MKGELSVEKFRFTGSTVFGKVVSLEKKDEVCKSGRKKQRTRRQPHQRPPEEQSMLFRVRIAFPIESCWYQALGLVDNFYCIPFVLCHLSEWYPQLLPSLRLSR
ncbi:hypothetical protein ACKS0A_02697 [Histoplasma ohiense]